MVMRPSTEQIWSWLSEVEDPEIPVISITDLGIVRSVQWLSDSADAPCVVTITPTYSGCPATQVIAKSITDCLHQHGVYALQLQTQMAPPWTTDWMSEDGKRKLRDYGIAPPLGLASSQTFALADIGRGAPGVPPGLACPHCGSGRLRLTSQFGSTPCKALYRCLDCQEPFDYFKCH